MYTVVCTYVGPTPMMVTANFNIESDTFVIAVSWQVCTHVGGYMLYYRCKTLMLTCICIQVPEFNCTANITTYSITVMDQYSQANLTVPANISSVETSEFPDNGTSIVANREYTITVSAISDQGTSYPSDPVVVSKSS